MSLNDVSALYFYILHLPPIGRQSWENFLNTGIIICHSKTDYQYQMFYLELHCQVSSLLSLGNHTSTVIATVNINDKHTKLALKTDTHFSQVCIPLKNTRGIRKTRKPSAVPARYISLRKYPKRHNTVPHECHDTLFFSYEYLMVREGIGERKFLESRLILILSRLKHRSVQ